ncbi:MAG: 50S ribosomal protein L5 [Candidatus Micrarchaeales archaeon]|nr:50S ribosomal protein L5 [Candidatus Micrarchaeales archaeon]
MADENKMRELVLDKLVINIGTGSDENTQAHAKRLLEIITNRKPADAVSKKRNPAFKVSKGQKIGAFVTIRGQDIKPLASRLIDAVDNRLKETAVADNSVSFGIHEYIDISGVKYDPKIGMLGMNVNLAFKRRGTRVALRKRMRATIPKKHRIVERDRIKDYMTKEFKVKFV